MYRDVCLDVEDIPQEKTSGIYSRQENTWGTSGIFHLLVGGWFKFMFWKLSFTEDFFCWQSQCSSTQKHRKCQSSISCVEFKTPHQSSQKFNPKRTHCNKIWSSVIGCFPEKSTSGVTSFLMFPCAQVSSSCILFSNTVFCSLLEKKNFFGPPQRWKICQLTLSMQRIKETSTTTTAKNQRHTQ